MKENDEKLNTALEEGIASFSKLLSGHELIEPETAADIIKNDNGLRHEAERRSRKVLYSLGLVNKKLKANVKEYLEKSSSFEKNVKIHNEKIAQERVADIGNLINPVEGRNLDTQQLASIALDLHTRLVIAGAGTGKTTTIVGLVKYLLTSGKANPEDILTLSFTNATVDELNKRIKNETGQRLETTTFHRLGLKIIASSNGKVPKISKLALSSFISEEIHKKRTDSHFMKLLSEYLVYDFDGQKDENTFDNQSEYAHYLKENPLITLKGEKVKSYGECDIANILAMNGVAYEYEASYEKDTNDSEYGQYHPDFHIKNTNIYIEYFGIGRNGDVAKFMIDKNPDASEEYRKGIEWKRNIHRENGTRLIELFAYNRSDGVLQELLEKKLKELNVPLNPSSPDTIFDEMIRNDKWKFNSAVSSFTTILTLIKETGKPWDEAYPKGDTFIGRRKGRRLEELLRPLYEAYQKKLSDAEEIDFEDMLNMASECITDGKYHHPYKYVIVDEYQDISCSRFRLLYSMRRDRDFKMYCVGDDWQSIYRFNGSNISYILDFEKYWGPSSICKIETTYRFNGELLRLSSEFICRNSRQYHKQLRSTGLSNCPVRPLLAPTESSMRYKIGEVLKHLPESSSVLFLGRYNHDVTVLEGEGYSWKPNIGDKSVSVSYSPRKDLNMTFMTIHGSKGLQADCVISLNNKTGKYGFPGNRDEPPVIKDLLGSDDTQYDEERRLFYVAMTRAKKCLYLASYTNRQSSYYREIFHINDDPALFYCPVCGGQLVIRKGKFGRFIGCENYYTRGCKFTREIDQDKNVGRP